MKIEILRDSITGNYSWVLDEGPENIDEFCGFENTLGEVFEEIIHYRAISGLGYLSDALETVTGLPQA